MPLSMPTLRGTAVTLGVALLILTTGCGGPKTKPVNVSGKVTYKGQPLNYGTIEFHGPGGKIASAAIGEDGSFRAHDAPVGENAVAVKVVPPVQPPPGTTGMPTLSVKPILIPAPYADPTKSGVKQTIAAGDSTVTIDLK